MISVVREDKPSLSVVREDKPSLSIVREDKPSLSVFTQKFLNSLPKLHLPSNNQPIVTRFPPAPSGCLHIGHLKAIVLNQALATKYAGKCLFRIDNTNPDLDSLEFENMIIDDIKTLGFSFDGFSHTSDHFPQLLIYAHHLISSNLAYLDDTPPDLLKLMRTDMKSSPNRDLPPEFHLNLWNSFISGSLPNYCLRLKIDMTNLNYVLRDPVIYRYMKNDNDNKNNKYYVYPTYDFACPLVDSIEGVTHTLRTTEYDTRDVLYHWILEKCNCNKIQIMEFSKLQIDDTILSKRKLKELIDNKSVSGWDDPRLPTIRGLIARGVTIPAMIKFVADQGMAKKNGVISLDKLMAFNKQELDLKVPRYICVETKNIVTLHLNNISILDMPLIVPKHTRNDINLGHKSLNYVFQKDQTSIDLLIDYEDSKWLIKDMEFTLIYWGNCIITDIKKSENFREIWANHHPTGDPKLTDFKLTWLINQSSNIPGKIFKYDSLTKDNNFQQIDILIEPSITDETLGSSIQFMRKGFYIRKTTQNPNEHIWIETLSFPKKLQIVD